MQNYKQRPNKRRILPYVFVGFFLLFVILSFFSINNVYGFDNEIIKSNNVDDISIYNINNTNNYLDNDSNQIVLFGDDLNYSNDSIKNTSLNITENSENSNITIELEENSTIKSNVNINNDNNINNLISANNQYSSLTSSSIANSLLNNQSPSSSNDNYFNDNYKNINVHYLMDNRDTLDKIEEKSTNIDNTDNIEYDNFYSISQYYNLNFNNFNNSDNYNAYLNDLKEHINNNIVVLISSDFKGLNLEHFNNFIKEIANLNLNKINNEEDNSIIRDFQSSSKPTLTILFFIKIFMEHHDNGKEHLSSF